MSAEAYVALVVFGYGLMFLLTAAVLVVLGTLVAACLGPRGMGHQRTFGGKVIYAIQSVFG